MTVGKHGAVAGFFGPGARGGRGAGAGRGQRRCSPIDRVGEPGGPRGKQSAGAVRGWCRILMTLTRDPEGTGPETFWFAVGVAPKCDIQVLYRFLERTVKDDYVWLC